MAFDPELTAMKPEIYWSMLQTAEQVAKRYNISRDAQDEYGASSQQKRLRHRRPACSKPKSPP
jgi:acetyl-CoA C-acetyltransferase